MYHEIETKYHLWCTYHSLKKTVRLYTVYNRQYGEYLYHKQTKSQFFFNK